jgi:hypothetical protein
MRRAANDNIDAGRLRDFARALRWSIYYRSTLVWDNTDLLQRRARAGQRFSSFQLQSATVWEFDITPDKWSAPFKHILRAIRKAGW